MLICLNSALSRLAMKIKLKKNEYLSDWYHIVRAKHDGRYWTERIDERTSRCMLSERLSPEACIEGTKDEMQQIARAITARSYVIFKSCAVDVRGKTAYFWNPRGSEKKVGVSLKHADEFAAHVVEELGEAP